MDDKARKDFLAASNYRTMRKRMLCSTSMKEFLQLMESEMGEDEHAFVADFVRAFEEEIVDVRRKFYLFSLKKEWRLSSRR